MSAITKLAVYVNQPHTHTDPARMYLKWTGVDTFRSHSRHSAEQVSSHDNAFKSPASQAPIKKINPVKPLCLTLSKVPGECDDLFAFRFVGK